ncbi:MAG: PKD domain-containing protein, partial [Bacteroidota bacterium]
GSNGWISFDNVSNVAHCFPSFPSPGGNGDNLLGPFMSDLNFNSSFPNMPNPGECWFWTNNKDSAVVTYYNTPWWQTGTPDWFGSNTFQVLLDAKDSSITYTYQNINSTFNDLAGCPQDIVLGIENSTGNVGLECWADSLPGNNYAIRFFYPGTPLLSVKDLTPVWNQNDANGGEFYPLGLIPQLDALVKNVGNDDFTTTSTINGSLENLGFTPVYTSSVTLPSLTSGDDTLLTFLPQANIATAGQYFWEVTTNNANDINPGNNINTAEINLVDLSGASATLTYATGGVPNGTLGWNGGATDDGMGVYMEPPVYPVDIASLEFYVGTATADGFIATVYDDNGPNGAPGTVLFTDTIPFASVTTGTWNTVTLPTAITINSGGFYVAFFMGGPTIFLSTETNGPISRRSYEILGGQWAEYRENNLRDFLIEVNIQNFPCAITSGFSATSSSNVANFTNLSTGGTSYVWDFGDGNTSTQTSPQHTYSMLGTYQVCLVATNNCGSDTSCQMVNITCPPPVAGFSYATTGISVNFSDTTSGPISTWLWDFGDGNTSTQQNPFHTYGTPGTYQVCLTTTGACGTDSVCWPVTVCAFPVANFNATTNGLAASFSNFSSGGVSFSWDFGDGNTSAAMSPMHTYTMAGTYTVCLITTNACDADTNCQTVTVCESPVSQFGSQMNQLVVDFADNSTNMPTSWAWDFGDGNTSTSQNPQHMYGVAGTYTVCLIASNSCGSDTSCSSVTVSVVGIEDEVAGMGLELWPNPVRDQLQVEVTLPYAADLTLRVRDLAGRTLYMERVAGATERWQPVLDVQALSSGMYFVEVESGESRMTRKFVRE